MRSEIFILSATKPYTDVAENPDYPKIVTPPITEKQENNDSPQGNNDSLKSVIK